MARFSVFHYLFAVLAVLALVANALPASTQPNTGSVAGMPGMATEFDKNGNADSSTQEKHTMNDSEEDYMDEMEHALEVAAKATATTAAPTSRPTPGVPTTAPTQKPQSAASAAPSASAPAAKKNSPLSNIPLVGGLLSGVPI